MAFPSKLQKNAAHAVPIFMEPSFNTSDHVSPQIDDASRVPFFLAICPSARILHEEMCRSTCGHRRTRALLTHTSPSQSVHPCDFHRRVPSSSGTPADSNPPTAALVRIRLLAQAVRLCCWPPDFATDQPRTAHVTFSVVHPLQRERIATVVVALLIDNFEHTMCPRVLHFLFSSIVQ